MDYLFVIILGLVFGSFVTALSYRLPRGIGIGKGRSFCDKCKKEIKWYDNIPLLSYIFLGGKCRFCRKKISIRYPLIEIFVSFAIVTLFAAWKACLVNFSQNPVCLFSKNLNLLFPVVIIFIVIFFALAIITDLEEMIIPDTAVYSLIIIATAILIFANPEKLYINLFTAFGFSVLFLLLNLITFGKGMGLGDVKLAIPIVLFLGWPIAVPWFMMSFIIGAFFGLILLSLGMAKFGKKIPFGPYMIISFYICFMFGDKIFSILFPYLK